MVSNSPPTEVHASPVTWPILFSSSAMQSEDKMEGDLDLPELGVEILSEEVLLALRLKLRAAEAGDLILILHTEDEFEAVLSLRKRRVP